MIALYLIVVFLAFEGVRGVAFSTECWEVLNGKRNLLADGHVAQVNKLPQGWTTRQSDDWLFYPQQYINVSLTSYQVSMATVGGCTGPNRFKPSGFIFEDHSSGDKTLAIADEPLTQTVHVESDYMHYFVDDHAVNLTFLPSWNVPDKQAILYELAFDRGLVITFEFFDHLQQTIGNVSTGVLRNSIAIPDVVLPRLTRSIVRMTRQNALQCSIASSIVCVPVASPALRFVATSIRPVRFLCRQPSHSVLLCIFLIIGSFIFTEAWNVINSQSSIFHTWLPRAAKIVGCYCVLVLFGLRVTLDLPTYVITYARDPVFLVLNGINTLPMLVANLIVIAFFVHRAITFEACDMCRAAFLQNVLHAWAFRRQWKQWARTLLGVDEYIRIPYPVKISLSIMLYCISQLIPVLLTHLVGVGGRVPTYICLWAPYLTQLQYHPNPMSWATRTFFLMKVNVYLTVLVAGGCFTGTLYFMAEITFIGTLIVLAIQCPRAWYALYNHVGSGAFFASFFIALIVQMIQKRLTRLLFLTNGTYFGIKNRAPLLHYWYFMMFTSMTRALTSYVVRSLKLLFRYPFFSTRVDRNAETWSVRRGDGGFVGYCGMLLAEHQFNNPIVLVFVESVLHRMRQRQARLGLCRAHAFAFDMEKSAEKTTQRPRQRSSMALNRWFVAITLINNPQVKL
ncbi:hypothetical protein BC940DRAFT_230886 [Gongronella butleri]|nr:hypothetical protein BC940DRAFT_230886 [Gongronella butleri]